jgi:hypothetical protein
VTFTIAGFNVVKRDGIELTPEFTAPINVTLNVGDLQETVMVSVSTRLVDVQNVTQGEKTSREVLDMCRPIKACSHLQRLHRRS